MGRDARHNPHSHESKIRLSPVCYDQIGAPLEEDCRVLITQPLQARVVKIAPIMDPKVPANFLAVEIHSITRVLTPMEAPLQHVFRLADPPSQAQDVPVGSDKDPDAPQLEPRSPAP